MTVVPTSVRNVGRQMDVRDGVISCLHVRPRPNCRYADGIGSSWVRENYETERESEGERRDEGATAERGGGGGGSSRHFFTR